MEGLPVCETALIPPDEHEHGHRERRMIDLLNRILLNGSRWVAIHEVSMATVDSRSGVRLQCRVASEASCVIVMVW